jgi:hypothetical protein
MCTSASKKKPSSRRPCVCKKGCMRVKRVAGDAGDCRGLSAERDPGGANFLTRKSLKTGVKNFKLFSLYGSPAIPRKFSVRARGVGQKSPAIPRDPRKLVSRHYNSISGLRGFPRTARSNHFTDVHRTFSRHTRTRQRPAFTLGNSAGRAGARA